MRSTIVFPRSSKAIFSLLGFNSFSNRLANKLSQNLFYFLLLSCFLLVFSTGCKKDKEDDQTDQVEVFYNDINELTELSQRFVENWIQFETAIFDTCTNEQIFKIFDDFTDSGIEFVELLEKLLQNQKAQQLKSGYVTESAEECFWATTGLFDISGISVGLVKGLGDDIKNVKELARQIKNNVIWDPDHPNYDPNLAYEGRLALERLRIEALKHQAKVGASALAGGTVSGLTAAAIISKVGIGVAGIMTAPALVTIGTVGAVTSYATFKLLTWYTKSNKGTEEDILQFSAITWELDKPLPSSIFTPDSKLAICIEGYEPVLIDRLIMPEEGEMISIEIDLTNLSELKSTGTIGQNYQSNSTEVCFYRGPMPTIQTCDQVQFVVAEPSSYSPAPGQTVIVTANGLPILEGCDLHFTIVGTDGYSKSETHSTNASGLARFSIPGASPGVNDRVTIRASSGASYVVSYSFRSDDKTGSSEALYPRR